MCICSALDAQGLALVLSAEAEAEAGAAPTPFVAAVADEAAEEAARALGWEAGLVVKAGSPEAIDGSILFQKLLSGLLVGVGQDMPEFPI